MTVTGGKAYGTLLRVRETTTGDREAIVHGYPSETSCH